MPLYEYQCDACSHQFEIIQKFSDPPVAACPRCGGSVKKLLSSPAIQFKGSGWYITDYARAGKGDRGAAGAAGEAPSGDSTSEARTEAKDKGDTKAGATSEPAKSAPKPSASSSSSG